MLVSVQRFAVNAPSMERTVWALYGRGLWIHILRQRGMGADENLVPGLGYGRPTESRNLLGLTLQGRSFIRHGDGMVAERIAGDTLIAPGRASFRSGMHYKTDVSLSINIEIDRLMHCSAPTEMSFGRIGPSVLADIRERTLALTAAIEHAWATSDRQPSLGTALSRLFVALHHEGFSLPSVDAVAMPVEAMRLSQLQNVGRSVDIAVSQVGTRPMLVDVEGSLAISTRTIQRAFPELCAMWVNDSSRLGRTVAAFDWRAHAPS